ncbi:MAG TPA: hypothetical protein VGO89_06090, partial [Streptomyces sp.]|nr:hypothetical protein [Streptomyces sp.]
MGRHSRKGRAKAGDTSERTVKRGDAPPSYGMAHGDTAMGSSAPYPSDPVETPPDGVPEWQGGGHRPPVRGGHPEQREPGGGWGADGTGRGPAGGRA